MQRWTTLLVLAAALLLSGGSAMAMSADENDEGGRAPDNYAFGIGVGLVEPSSDTETYLTASLRLRAHREGRDSADEELSRNQGITGYFEPEIGYWKRSADNNNRINGSDTLLGINMLGVVPFGHVDTFFGVGAGVHFVDAKLLTGDARESGSKTKLGLNAQFGVDIYLTRKWSAFGTGRFDLVQDSQDDVQTKVYVGVRTRW